MSLPTGKVVASVSSRIPLGGTVVMVAANRNTWLLSWTTFGTRQWGNDFRREPAAILYPLFPQWAEELRAEEQSAAWASTDRRVISSAARGARVLLTYEQAEQLLSRFQETAVTRSWKILAVAISRSQVQILVESDADVTVDSMLRDFQSHGGQALDSRWTTRTRDGWWGDSGTMRKKHSAGAVASAVRYIANQNNPLLTWVAPAWRSCVRCA